MMVACPHCGSTVLRVLDSRDKPIDLDPEGVELVLPLAFVIPDRLDGFTASGDRIAGRHPREGEAPTGRLHLPHKCDAGTRARRGRHAR